MAWPPHRKTWIADACPIPGHTDEYARRVMKIRCLVVDNEPVERDRIVSLLDPIPDAEVVGECETGSQAIQAIAEDRPDLVFLDVQLPDIDGFGVIEAIHADAAPAVVFVTAYEEYAFKAFEVRACDYLLKPFDAERFGTAFRHVAERIRADRAVDAHARLTHLLDRFERGRLRHQNLPIRTRGRVYFLDIDEIDWIEAADNYVKVHAHGAVHVTRQTLRHMEESLASRGFVRIHRSTIVNIARLQEIQPWFGGEYVVLLRDGTRVTSSRAYRSRIQALME